jgi:hypothetical protein
MSFMPRTAWIVATLYTALIGIFFLEGGAAEENLRAT